MPPVAPHAIKDPPFYGCRIGGNLYGTKAGLMINDEMQVISTKGTVIPGLYAGWHTAGGAARTATSATLSWVRCWAT